MSGPPILGTSQISLMGQENFGQLDLDIHGSFKDDVRIVEQRLAQVPGGSQRVFLRASRIPLKAPLKGM